MQPKHHTAFSVIVYAILRSRHPKEGIAIESSFVMNAFNSPEYNIRASTNQPQRQRSVNPFTLRVNGFEIKGVVGNGVLCYVHRKAGQYTVSSEKAQNQSSIITLRSNFKGF